MIDVLSGSVSGVLSACDSTLGQGAARFVTSADVEAASHRRFEDDRRRTLAGRAALRLLVSARLGGRARDAPDLPIDRRCTICGAPHGRPRLSAASLSSSTSGDHLLVAAGAAGEQLGVDVQEVPRSLWRGFDSYLFHPAERSCLGDGEAGRDERIMWWAMKEAALKAMGIGLRVSPSTVRVETEPSDVDGSSWRRVRADAPADRTLWVTTFSPAPRARAAVVSDRPRRLLTRSIEDVGLTRDHRTA